jgi:hypothetical protein
MVIQPTSLVAVQAQLNDVDTENDPLPPAAAIDMDAGDSE